MQRQLRSTRTTRAVLTVLIDGFEDDLWGLRVCHLTSLPSGTVYPILSTLEDLGWVHTNWDDSTTTGPRRRFYHLTPNGLEAAKQLLRDSSPRAALTPLKSAPQAGLA